MVELNREMGLDFFELFELFEKALDKKVDVLTTGIRDKDFLNKISNEGILLYEE